jgi:hypothetical protein
MRCRLSCRQSRLARAKGEATLLLLRVLFWISEIVVVALVIIPIFRFLLYQWGARKQEFDNRFTEKTLSEYLARFYSRSDETAKLSNTDQFNDLYRRMAGRHLYYVPSGMLLIIATVLSGLVIMTAIRAGYETYIVFYQSWLTDPSDATVLQGLSHLPLAVLDVIAFPFPNIVLSPQSLAAIAGAYLFVVGVVIQGFRAKTLTSSDVLWCCFRMVIAVPMAISIGQLANSSLGAFIAFALGAFPMETITRLLRRVTAKTLNDSDDVNSDQLVRLAGVTPEISAVLAGEGIGAIQQLASIDPVALAIRTALPFDYILDLVSQAQAWRFIGPSTEPLAKLGLGNALSIRRLVDRLSNPADTEAKTVLAAAAAALQLDTAVLNSMFNELAADPYTGFLLDIAR